MADCPKYRYTGSWTQDVLNVFSSDTRGQTPVLSEYVAFEVTANSFNFGPWASAEIHVEGVDELGDVRQSFEYTCATTDTYPKTFGANSLGGATIQLRYYIQVPTNQVGNAISWDFEIQFIGDCVALPPFYSQTEDQWGFAHVSNNWWQFAPVPGTVPEPGWITALTCDQNNADKLYAIWQNDRYLRISTNAGVSWTSSVLFPSEPSPVPPPIVYSIQARGGQVFLFNHQASDSSNRGIWRSTNDGATWTQLTDRPNSGYMSLASTKLWYAEQDASGEIDFKRMNLDGSSIETLGHEPTYGGRLLVRALSDDLCLFTSRGNAQIHRVQPSGSVQICPSSFVPWDAVPLSPTVFMAVGTATVSSTDVLVQRTVNAGSSWTLVKTITSLEGFALNGTTDSYFMIDAAAPARTDLVMTGHASSTVQQNFWISSDAGLTWTKILNEAEPPGWSVINPGGVVARPAVQPIVSIPSRLATIVG